MSEGKDLNIEQFAEREYEKAAKQYTYPKGIVDNNAYDNYLMLSNQWKNHIQRHYKININKKVIEFDLAQPTKYIDNLIEEHKIPKSDADIIKNINLEIYNIVMKAALFKKRAYGDIRVGFSEDGNFIPDEISSITPIAIDLFGRYFKAEEVHQVIQQDLEIMNVTVYQLKKIFKDNIGKIKELQEQFRSSYSDVRLGYKKSRLEELQYLYNERKQIYFGTKAREDETQLAKLLDQIKKECDGDLVINGSFNLQIEQKATLIVEHQILKELNLPMMILAKVAGKRGLNPVFLLSRLANSRYSQFTGFGYDGISKTALTDEIEYPSQLTYDWNYLTAKCEQQREEDNKQSQIPEVINLDQVKNLKEMLLNKLDQAKKPLDEAKKKGGIESI